MNTNSIFRRVETWLPLALIAAGILLRAEYLREYAAFLNFNIPVGPDVMEYDLRAREILNGRLFPVRPDIHAPLYSLFLALLYKLGNFSLLPVRILQLALNGICWILLEKLLERKGVSFKIRMIFLGSAMLYPVAFFHQAEIISESLLLPFITAVLWMTELAETEFSLRKRLIFSAAAGAAAGLAAVTHPLSLPFTAALFICRLLQKARQEALVFLAGTLLIILPAAGIKSLHYGQLTGIQQNGGFNIWLGNNPDAPGTCYLRPGPVWRALHKNADAEAKKRNISADRVWLERSGKFWLTEPLKGIKLYLTKALLVCSPAELIAGADPGALVYRTRLVRYGSLLLPLLLFFAVRGIIETIRRKEKYALPFFLLGGSLYAAQILTVTSGRYRLSMLPALLFFAACGAADFKWKKYFILPLLLLMSCLPILTAAFNAETHEAAAILGEAALRTGKGETALKMLLYAKEGCFDPARISNQIGMLRERSNDFAGAEKDYLEAMKGDPESMESSMNLANLYSRFPSRHKEAEKYYAAALKLAPGSAILHYNYAVHLNNTNRPAAAEKELLRSLECDSSYHLSYNLLGIIAVRTNRLEAAEKCFRAASELAPENAGYRRNLEFIKNGNRSPSKK